MNFIVKDKLEKDEHKNVVNFLDSLNFYSIEQHPDWNTRLEEYRHLYFLVVEGEVVNCFANVILSKGLFKTATINFGTAFNDFEVLKK